jgi:mannose-6-phosphate isomerase-like protein (cupin superfamily)
MSAAFEVRSLSDEPDVFAPDGAAVRILASTDRGSMAHFALEPGQVSRAVAHHTVDEVWYIVEGRGRMALKSGVDWQVLDLSPGISFSIPVGTHFQFRNDGTSGFAAVAVTMPPWPTDHEEAYPVEGLWQTDV